MASRLQPFRRCYLHHTVLYKAYYQRSIRRRFVSKPDIESDGIPGKANPNHIIRILFVSSILGGGVAYWNGWMASDIITFTKERFSYINILNDNKDTKSSGGSVYKLPKPKSSQPIEPKSKPKPKPKPKPKKDVIVLPKPKPKPKPKVIPKPTPKPEVFVIAKPTPPEPKQEPPKPKPAPKAKPKPVPNIVKIESSKEASKEVSELIEKYDRIKKEVLDMTFADEKEEGKTKIVESKPKKPLKVEMNDSEKEKYRKEITALKNMIDKKQLKIEELERDLNDKNEFLEENLKNLEEGRKAYDEITQIFEEMRIEYSEQMLQQMENMENERKNRMNKLTKLNIDIRVIEKIMNWYDVNNKFFLSLAELNNILYKFEQKVNNGLSYDNELKYLLHNIPTNFISYQLLNNLNKSQTKNNIFHINSQQQLYDRFCVLETALRETAMTPKSTNSLWGNLFAKIFSFLLIKEQISRSGTSLNDRISRAGNSMKLGDLDSTLNELNYLDEDVLYPAQDWLKCARQRLLGLSAIKMLKSELLSRSIKMVDNE